MNPPAPCALCGNHQRNDVETILVRWLEPVNGSSWDTIPRCRDRGACRQRFHRSASAKALETGEMPEAWPLRDSDWVERLPLPDPLDVVPPPAAEPPPALPPEPPAPATWAMSSTFVDEPDEEVPWI